MMKAAERSSLPFKIAFTGVEVASGQADACELGINGDGESGWGCRNGTING